MMSLPFVQWPSLYIFSKYRGSMSHSFAEFFACFREEYSVPLYVFHLDPHYLHYGAVLLAVNWFPELGNAITHPGFH